MQLYDSLVYEPTYTEWERTMRLETDRNPDDTKVSYPNWYGHQRGRWSLSCSADCSPAPPISFGTPPILGTSTPYSSPHCHSPCSGSPCSTEKRTGTIFGETQTCYRYPFATHLYPPRT